MELIVDVFEKDTNYWLVRTSSGKWYEDFVEGNFIAIETQGLAKEELKNLNSKEDIKSLLDAKIQNAIDNFDRNYEEEKDQYYFSTIEKMNIPEQSKSHISSRIHAFVNEISEGDYIIIPSGSSRAFAIGVVTSNVLEENDSAKQLNLLQNSLTGENKYLTLLRKVNWVKFVSRKDVPLELLNSFLTVHHSIISLNPHKFHFQNLINPFFIDEESMLNMRVQVLNNEGLPTEKWLELMSKIKDTEILSKTTFKEVKVDVQSPGDINLIAEAFNAIKDPVTASTIVLCATTIFYKSFGMIQSVSYRHFTKEGRSESKANVAKHKLDELKHKIEYDEILEKYNKDENNKVETTIQVVSNKTENRQEVTNNTKEKDDQPTD